MKLEQRFAPQQLATISIVGGFLIYAPTWIFELFTKYKEAHWESSHRAALGTAHTVALGTAHRMTLTRADLVQVLWPIVLVLGLGFWMNMAGRSALRRGVEQERWDRQSLDRLHGTLKSAWLTWLCISPALVSVIYIIVCFMESKPTVNGMMGLSAVPSLSLSGMVIVLKPESEPTPHGVWREPLKPIQSVHWGER